MFQFYWPWFGILLPLPFILRWVFPNKKPNDPYEIYFPGLNRLKKAFPSHTRSLKTADKLFLFLLSFSWIFLILALMQPEKVDQFRQTKSNGYDLMLAVDISGSMQAVDFSTPTKVISRLDVTKEVVSKFVKGREGDRVGLVTFGQYAYLHVPLTLDTQAVSRMLNDTISGMAGNATAIGDAIGLSIKTLRERPEGSRVLVLLTDGEDNSSSVPPLEAAKLAKQYGIKIYTIAVGTKGQVPIPLPTGGYAMANVNVDEELLKNIALTTGGQFYVATNKSALELIYKKINQLEKTEANETLYLIREPFYTYPLALSLFFLLICTLYQLLSRRSAYGVSNGL